MKWLLVPALLGLVGCRRESSTQTGGVSAAASSEETSAGLAQLVSDLKSIHGDPLPAQPTLADNVRVTTSNTLVMARDELAMICDGTRASSARTPERTVLVDLMIEAQGGEIQNRGMLTEASRATALGSLGQIAYIAVVEERGWLHEVSMQRIGIWDRAARQWVGTLNIALPLIHALDKEMGTYHQGQVTGPTFTVSEAQEARQERHRHEIATAVLQAIRERRTQWVTLPESVSGSVKFSPESEQVYTVSSSPNSPAIGSPNAKVEVQVFANHGDDSLLLLMHRIAQVYGDRVRVVWRDRASLPDDKAAANAAREVLAIQGIDAFWQYADRLADRRTATFRSLTIDDLLFEATKLGIDSAKVRKAIESNAYGASIAADQAAFRATKVRTGLAYATFVNGWTLSTTSFAEHAARIDAALQATGSASAPAEPHAR